MNDILGCGSGGMECVLCDTNEVQERRVVTHLKPSGWLVELGCWYAWA